MALLASIGELSRSALRMELSSNKCERLLSSSGVGLYRAPSFRLGLRYNAGSLQPWIDSRLQKTQLPLSYFGLLEAYLPPTIRDGVAVFMRRLDVGFRMALSDLGYLDKTSRHYTQHIHVPFTRS